MNFATPRAWVSRAGTSSAPDSTARKVLGCADTAGENAPSSKAPSAATTMARLMGFPSPSRTDGRDFGAPFPPRGGFNRTGGQEGAVGRGGVARRYLSEI